MESKEYPTPEELEFRLRKGANLWKLAMSLKRAGVEDRRKQRIKRRIRKIAITVGVVATLFVLATLFGLILL